MAQSAQHHEAPNTYRNVLTEYIPKLEAGRYELIKLYEYVINYNMNAPSRDLIIVHGFPGAGKTTQSRRLCKENPGMSHISIGEVWRGVMSGGIDSEYSDKLFHRTSPRNSLMILQTNWYLKPHKGWTCPSELFLLTDIQDTKQQLNLSF